MMERKFARYFFDTVKELIPEQYDQEKVFESLKRYQSSQDLGGLLTDLRKQLNEPSKLELYEHIRPLVLPKHQLEYSQKTPQTPGIKLRVIRLTRNPGESLGFAVRGGFEHGIGVFVSEVQQKSQAEKRGLKAGDEIVRVNGFTITEAIHEDVLNLIKSRDEIILKVTHIGMLPVKSNPNETVSWNYVENMDSTKALQEVLDKESVTGKRDSGGPDIKIFINTTGVASIGCGIMSGPNHFPGIYVEKVRSGSLAEEVGLEVGDQIIEVNGTNFHGISHKEAVVTLKSSTQLNMVIKKKLGLPLFQQNRQKQRKPEPATNFRPTIISVSEEPTPAPSFQPQIRSLQQTNQVVSDRSVESEDNGLDQEQLIQQHLSRGKFLTTVMVENPNPAAPEDEAFYPPPMAEDEPLPPPPAPEELEIMQQDQDGMEAVTSFSMRSTEREALEEDITHFEPDFAQVDFNDDDGMPQKPMLLGGKAAIMAARQARNMGPTLLGASSQSGLVNMDAVTDIYSLFPSEVTDEKELLMVSITLDEYESLGIGVEGGIGTPLADKILIADLYGAAERNGELEKGDQVLMAAGRSFLDLSSAQAVNILREAETKNMGSVKLIVAKGGLLNDEDAVTYF